MSHSPPKCPVCKQEAPFIPHKYESNRHEIMLYQCTNCASVVGVVDNSMIIHKLDILTKRIEKWSITMQQILTEYQEIKRNQMRH
jgi:transposase-like protein